MNFFKRKARFFKVVPKSISSFESKKVYAISKKGAIQKFHILTNYAWETNKIKVRKL